MKTVYFTFCLIFLLMLNSCCKSELDFIKNNRKNYISDNLSNENNLSSSSFEFYKLFGEDYLKQYLYKNDSIPLNFCNNSKDSISVEFKKNPISVEDNNLEIIIKSNVKIKEIGINLLNASSYESQFKAVLNYKNQISPYIIELDRKLMLINQNCIVCYFVVTEENCTKTGFSRVYVK